MKFRVGIDDDAITFLDAGRIAERGAECTRGDVDAVVALGFRSLKVDGCGAR